MNDALFGRGDIVLCALPGDFGKPGPAVVAQSDLFNPTHASIVVCPISSEITNLSLFRVLVDSGELSGLKKPSEIMVDKITAASRKRIRDRIGALSRKELAAMNAALRLWLELPEAS